jgi:hypothetical protein
MRREVLTWGYSRTFGWLTYFATSLKSEGASSETIEVYTGSPLRNDTFLDRLVAVQWSFDYELPVQMQTRSTTSKWSACSIRG